MPTGLESAIVPLMYMFLFNILIAWPFWRIYRRAGLPPWWSLTSLIPLIGLVVVIALLGHARWPNLPPRQKAPAPKTRREVAQTAPQSSVEG